MTLRELLHQLEQQGDVRLRPPGYGGWFKPLNFCTFTAKANMDCEARVTGSGYLYVRDEHEREILVARVVDAPRPALYRRKPDSQRGKLYAAENKVPRGEEMPDLKAVERYLADMQARSWWRWGLKLVPGKRAIESAPIRVADGRGRRSASGGSWTITLPRWARCERIILHEAAHCITPGKMHGREFAAAYLELVTRMMGKDAGAALRLAFREGGVRYKPKRQLTPEQLERLRARGRALAAAAKQRMEGGE